MFVSTGLEVRAYSKWMVAEVENAGARLKKHVNEFGNRLMMFTVTTTTSLAVNGGGASTLSGITQSEK